MAQRNRIIDPESLKNLDVMDAKEAAVYIRSSPSTLAKFRCFGGGPVYIRQSARKTLYRRTDLDRWLEDRARNNNASVG